MIYTINIKCYIMNRNHKNVQKRGGSYDYQGEHQNYL